MTLKELEKYLYKIYSKDTCYPVCRDDWCDDNPTLGHCAIVSLLVNDYFGGEIYKIKVDGISHYFNLIDNNVVDFTSNQFNKEINYNGKIKKDRLEILQDEDTLSRHKMLKMKLQSVMEEIFDVYTRDGEYIGTRTRSFCHSESSGVYHKPVWIWIINDNKEVLVQKRAACKKLYPNTWDMPSAGHVLAGETSLEGAIRETYEELGIQTKEDDYEFICEYIVDSSYEIAQVYLLYLNLKVEEFKLQPEEVAEVKWLSFEEFKKLFYSDEFVRFDDEYREIIVKTLSKKLK